MHSLSGRIGLSLLTTIVTFTAFPAFAADVENVVVAKGDWPWWRGPQSNGVAEPDQTPPTTWSATEHVLWKADVPGRGHSSPTVIGDRVLLATADEEKETQSVLCWDRKTGELRWTTEVHSGGLDRKGNKKSTQASASVACDGQRLFVNFLNDGAILTTALDLDGKQLWQTKVSDFATHQGFGSSPMPFGDCVYVTTDSRAGGEVAALHRGTGDVVWRQSRPQKANYASAVTYRLAGRDQLLVQGCDLVSSFDPKSGEKLWEIEGATTECVTSIVTDGTRIFVSGGYPRKHTQAIEVDGSGKTAWQNNTQVYVPSMVVKDGHLYAVSDNGVAVCWNSATGEETWKARLGGTFTASLVLVGDRIYAVNESGATFVFRANPAAYEAIAENRLGDEVYATPTICGSRVYMHVVESSNGKRQQRLYCLGN